MGTLKSNRSPLLRLTAKATYTLEGCEAGMDERLNGFYYHGEYTKSLLNKTQCPETSSQVAFTALRCKTQIARLDLVYSCEDWQLRSNKQIIGAIIPQATEDSLLKSHEQPGAQPIPCDVIAISQGHVQFPKLFPASDWRNLIKYARIEHTREYQDYYNVLWVGWEDGVAVRRGIGIVLQSVWDTLGAKTVSFIMG